MIGLLVKQDIAPMVVGDQLEQGGRRHDEKEDDWWIFHGDWI